MPHVLAIPTQLRAKLEDAATAAGGDECCGVLLGHDGEPRQVTDVVPLVNAADAAVRPHYFAFDPFEFMRVEDAAGERGLAVVGIYHSHPTGTPRPSETDRREAWPWYSYVILAPREGGWSLTSWRLEDEQMNEETVI